MRKLILRSLVVVVVVLFIFTLFFGTAILQEGNPLPILLAIAKLELSELKVVPISSKDDYLIQKAGKGEAPLTEQLSKYGWEFKDRLGSAIYYEKDGATLLVTSRAFSRRYIIYELDTN